MMPRYRALVDELHQMELRPFGWRTLHGSFQRARTIGKTLRKWRADWLLTSSPKYIPLLSLAKIFCSTKVCFHLGLPGTSDAWWMRKSMGRIDIGVSPSAHNAETWIQNGWPASHMHVVPNGVDCSRFDLSQSPDVLKKDLGLPQDSLVVAYVGRLAPEKGVGTLIRAFAKVAHHDERLILVLAGRSEVWGEDWQRLADSLSIPRHQLVFTGQIADPERIMAIATFVVVPSECIESFGLTVVEAMAAGKPVIGSDVGIIPGLLESVDANLVFPAGDVDSLVSRMIYWIDNEHRRSEVGRQLKADVAERYTLDSMAQGYQSLLAPG